MKNYHFLLVVVIFIVISEIKSETHRKQFVYHYDTEKLIRNLFKLVPKIDGYSYNTERLSKLTFSLLHRQPRLASTWNFHATKNLDTNYADEITSSLIKSIDQIIQKAKDEIDHLQSIGNKNGFIRQMNKFLEHVSNVRQQIIDFGCDDDQLSTSKNCLYYHDIVIALNVELNEKIKHFG
ncbi:uncharacterized protein LOC124494360 [Dermatophagoides farinae]|uniref:Uncharacterized protein n=1 Tax=Dermatophagoides farinae TaxID=6954 RepID=A0A922KYZ3_DERFA|nr:uncharacterized protein LOC124494360 [Dermatophagoides farinae]XP_046913491.1 uncharacterized protein LOC124494360 [Dermatophagoides farinae]XP_046913492.1 uncharacterized protein LOC124494360 [Dermatophagoides farinae]XP_046913493.1 uncharacterized protein LOC124494360 [Dermatophagoides farinae]KAH7644421.1 hypothetical protein HUG17_6783 [Dermatophagoides farinae]KAH9493634.1 hypothetical protein DERF_014374 [Dermatophagoides farinae]